ncbi:hypothetical protein SLE2022_210040 [Rubroshorea leprosula]
MYQESRELPPSLENCTRLALLDLGENKLFGKFPPWIRENLIGLSVLSLKSNEFYENIPPSLCYVESLQVLDLTTNNLSGAIPSCLNNLTIMAQTRSSNLHQSYPFNVFLNGIVMKVGVDYASIVWKRVEQEFRKTVNLLKIIDLPSNRLIGEIL